MAIQRDSWLLWVMAGVVASGAAARQPHAHSRSGHVTFAPHRILEGVGDSPSGLVRPAPVDVDGDGDLDIVGCGGQANDVFWLENLGALQFQRRLIAPITTSRAMAVGDINRDGRPDVLAFGGLNGELGVFLLENLGGPQVTFSSRLVVGPAHISQSFVSDLDDDGDEDLLTTRSVGSPLHWHSQTGGQFADQSLGWGPTTTVPFALVSEDLNADGRRDILLGTVPTAPHTLLWLRQTAESSPDFELVPLLAGGAGNEVQACLVHDFTNDGAPDIVYAQGSRDRVAILRNSASSPGSFDDPVVLFTDPDNPFNGLEGPINAPQDLALADLNEDGQDDIVVIGAVEDQIGWLRRSPEGDLQFEFQMIESDPDGLLGPLQGFADFPTKCSTADFDGDGDIDILTASRIDGSYVLWENRLFCREDIDGSGLIDFGDVNAVIGAFNTADGEPGFDAAADLDGDGAVGFADLNVLLGYFNSGCGAIAPRSKVSH